MKKKTIIVLTLFFIINLAIRLVHLGNIPALDWDEASVGYNAYSISQIGKDQWGNRLPLIFPAFGDYKGAFYIYSTAAVFKIFGASVFNLRLTSTVMGSLLPIIIFLLVFYLFNNQIVSYLSLIFISFSPWNFFYSRNACDGVMPAGFFISLGVLLLITSIKKNKNTHYLLSTFSFILAMFSYNLGKIIGPFFLVISFLTGIIKIKNKKIVCLAILITSLAFYLYFSQLKLNIKSRLDMIGVFGDKRSTVLDINELRDHDKNDFISKVFHNKLTYYFLTLSSNYIPHYSSDFLSKFRDYKAVQENYFAPLHPLFMIFFYLGIYFLIKEILTTKNRDQRFAIGLIIAWFLIAPLPSTVVDIGISGRRFFAGMPIIYIITSLGIYFIYKKLNKPNYRRFLLLFVYLTILYSTIKYSIYYFQQIPTGYKYVYAFVENTYAKYVKDHYSQYDNFITTRDSGNQIYIFLLFNLKYGPKKFINEKKYFTQDNGWFVVEKFDKFSFVSSLDKETLDNLLKNKKRTLIALDEKEYSKHSKLINQYKSTTTIIKSDPVYANKILYLIEIK
jgi:4-amino-4-deoxy-L-arabinose transferase-like glycosyltransferase